MMDNFVRYLKDDLKVGVEATSAVQPVYIDLSRVSRELRGAEAAKDKGTVARHMRQHLNEGYQGLGESFTDKDLYEWYSNAKDGGAFSFNLKPLGHDLCLINAPSEGQRTSKDLIQSSVALSGLNPAHFKELNWPDRITKEYIGRHEGEHCSQSPHEFRHELIQRELDADKAAVRGLREQGHHDIAQNLIDLRTIGIARDLDHTTGPWIDDPDAKMSVHTLTALLNVQSEMDRAVASQLGTSTLQLGDLRRQDPRAYAAALDGALKDGSFPPAFVDGARMYKLISPQEEAKLDTDEKFQAHVAQMRLDGKLDRPAEEKDAMKKFAVAYIGAIDRLMVPDTSPAPPSSNIRKKFGPGADQEHDHVNCDHPAELMKELANIMAKPTAASIESQPVTSPVIPSLRPSSPSGPGLKSEI